MISPSVSSRKLMTPWVAGWCGPMLRRPQPPPVVGEQQPPQVRVPGEPHAEQVPGLALVPLGGRPEVGHGRDLWPLPVEPGRDGDPVPLPVGEELVDDLEVV